jgi:hypothetical protein
VAHWKNLVEINKRGYRSTTFNKNGRCYQLDHFVACARDMKRICYAGPAPRQLVVSDHKTKNDYQDCEKPKKGATTI